jgi:hypothetical protein
MSKQNKSSGIYDDLDKEMEKTSDERFLRLEEDGDRELVFFADTPYVRYVYWDGKQTREWTEDCGQKKTLRVAQNVILCDLADGKIEIKGVKVLEQGKRFFQNVSKRDKKYGIRDWIFEIERSGEKGDTDTTYDIDPEHELSDKEREKLLAVKLIDLEQLYSELNSGDGDKKKRPSPAAAGKEEKEEKEDDEDDAISEAQRKELVEMFKTLDDPEGQGKKFCKEFGIDKVKNLPKSKFKKALRYIDKLTEAGKCEAEASDDDSPF